MMQSEHEPMTPDPADGNHRPAQAAPTLGSQQTLQTPTTSQPMQACAPQQPAQQMPHMNAQAPAPYAPAYMPPAPVPAPQPKKPSGWGIFILSLLCLGLITFGEVIGYLIGDATPIGVDLGSLSLGAIVGMICLVAMGGTKLLSPTRESWRTSWKCAWWFIAISVGLMLLDTYSILSDSSFELPHGWYMSFIETALLCVVIGLGEEVMVRGIILEGLLAPLGKTKRGVWIAIVLSSLYFGLLHVDFYTTDFSDALQLIQSVLKVLQTGVYGFALACLVVSTEDVLSVAFLHGLDDFLLFIPAVVLAGESTDVAYVSADVNEALITIGMYVIMILLYLPVAFKGAKLVRAMAKPTRGAIWDAREAKRVAASQPVYRQTVPMAQTDASSALGLANSSQNATADDAATLRESTSCDMGMTTVASDASMTSFDRP